MKFGWIAILAVAALSAAGCQQQEKAAEAPAATPAAPAAAPASPAAATASGGGAATGESCDGFVGTQCSSSGDFCKKPAGQCDVADAQGTCTTVPEVCTRDYRPVCGCDGRTYGNACEADRARVSIRAPGECKAAP